MSSRKKLYLSWVAGAFLLLSIFYLAVVKLWSAAEESHVSSLEKQIISSLSRDLAEGNLFKLGDTLSKLQRDGVLRFTEVRGIRGDSADMVFFTSIGATESATAAFRDFSCNGQRKLISRASDAVNMLTILPSTIAGIDCAVLYVSAEFPPELRRFRRSILLYFGALLTIIFTGFFWVSSLVYKRILALETRNAVIEIEKDAEIGRMAAQVAHDIRSPLAALGAAAKGLSLPEDQRTLVDGAIGRMNGIADDLLRRYRAPGAAEKSRIETHGLAGLIEQVVAEKRLQHKDKPGVKIEFSAAAGGLKAAVDAKELQRLISNLVNNSVAALSGPGTVAVRLGAEDGKVLIEIKDDGKGIPPEILARLGQKGETHGKAGGTGLGLYHARTAAESWGGGLKIESAPGKGTSVVITLPAAARPAAGLRAVLLDDDALVHMNWRLAAKAAGADLKLFKTPQELAAAAGTLPRDIPLYIDSELGDGLKGEDIAMELHGKGFADISMATGHSPEKFSHLPWLKVTGKEPPWA